MILRRHVYSDVGDGFDEGLDWDPERGYPGGGLADGVGSVAGFPEGFDGSAGNGGRC